MIDISILDEHFLAIFEMINERLVEFRFAQQIAIQFNLHQVVFDVFS